jgi:hypothetical protein
MLQQELHVMVAQVNVEQGVLVCRMPEGLLVQWELLVTEVLEHVMLVVLVFLLQMFLRVQVLMHKIVLIWGVVGVIPIFPVVSSYFCSIFVEARCLYVYLEKC